jgi:hypothetical protein
MGWNYLGILQNVLGRQQGCHVDILQSDVPRDQDNRNVNNRYISVPSKAKTTDGTGELQTYHSPNADYELPVRIVANRVRQTLTIEMRPGQYCGVSSRIMFDAIAVIRDS